MFHYSASIDVPSDGRLRLPILTIDTWAEAPFDSELHCVRYGPDEYRLTFLREHCVTEYTIRIPSHLIVDRKDLSRRMEYTCEAPTVFIYDFKDRDEETRKLIVKRALLAIVEGDDAAFDNVWDTMVHLLYAYNVPRTIDNIVREHGGILHVHTKSIATRIGPFVDKMVLQSFWQLRGLAKTKKVIEETYGSFDTDEWIEVSEDQYVYGPLLRASLATLEDLRSMTIYCKDDQPPDIAWYTKEEDESKQRTAARLEAIKEELMAVAWHPRRMMAWCLPSPAKKPASS